MKYKVFFLFHYSASNFPCGYDERNFKSVSHSLFIHSCKLFISVHTALFFVIFVVHRVGTGEMKIQKKIKRKNSRFIEKRLKLEIGNVTDV